MTVWESVPKSTNCLEEDAEATLAVQSASSRGFPVALDEHPQVSRIELGEAIEAFGKDVLFHPPKECGTGTLLEPGFLLCANNQHSAYVACAERLPTRRGCSFLSACWNAVNSPF